jgi:hypothetical protein
VKEVFKYDLNVYNKYTLVCLGLTVIFGFVALLLILLTNGIVLTREKEMKDANPDKIDKIQVSPTIEHNHYLNRTLFVTTTVTSWALLFMFFYDAVDKEKKVGLSKEKQTDSKLGENIYWLLGFIPEKLRQFDTFWHSIFKDLPIDPIVKMFLLFSVGFLAFFFIPFIKVYKRELTETEKHIYPPPQRPTLIEVVNFPTIFNANNDPNTRIDYPGMAAFFVSLMSSILVFLILFFAVNTVIPGKMSFVTSSVISFVVFLILLISLLLNKKSLGDENKFNAKNTDHTTNQYTTKLLLFLVITFTFGLFSAPVVTMIGEIILRMFNYSSINPLRKLSSSNSIWFWLIFLILPFLTIWFTLFFVGTYDTCGMDSSDATCPWFGTDNNKNFKILMIALLSVLVGWFFAFSPYFYMFYGLWGFVMSMIRHLLYIVGPIGILGISISEVILANKAATSTGKVSLG